MKIPPATLNQLVKLNELIRDMKFSKEKLQNIIGHISVFFKLAEFDWSQVDENQLMNFMESQMTQKPDWTTGSDIVRKIDDRIKKCEWNNIAGHEIKALAINFRDHEFYSDDLKVVSAHIDFKHLGKRCCLAYNLKQAINWIKDEAEIIGYQVKNEVNINNLSFRPGCEPNYIKDLNVIDLDIGTFRSRSPNPTISHELSLRNRWPGLEVFWLLAFNLKTFYTSNRTPKFLVVPGLWFKNDYGGYEVLYIHIHIDAFYGPIIYIRSMCISSDCGKASIVAFIENT